MQKTIMAVVAVALGAVGYLYLSGEIGGGGAGPTDEEVFIQLKTLSSQIEDLQDRGLDQDARDAERAHGRAVQLLADGMAADAAVEVDEGLAIARTALADYRERQREESTANVYDEDEWGDGDASGDEPGGSSGGSSGGRTGGGYASSHSTTVDMISTVNQSKTTPRLRGMRGKARAAAEAAERQQDAYDEY